MPFDNFTNDEKAGEKVRTNFVIELLRIGSFDVVDTYELDRRLQRAGLSYNTSSGIPPIIKTSGVGGETITSIPLSKQVGEVLNVEAILAGSVEAYSTERMADQIIPEVSISVRLIDAETSIIIWASAYSRRGSAGIPVFGWGKVTSLSVLSQQVIQNMAHALAKYTY
jgi:hypothetical protein